MRVIFKFLKIKVTLKFLEEQLGNLQNKGEILYG